MTAVATMEHSSYCPRERRCLVRHRINHELAAWVSFQRAVWLKREGKLPEWKAGQGLRTVRPIMGYR